MLFWPPLPSVLFRSPAPFGHPRFFFSVSLFLLPIGLRPRSTSFSKASFGKEANSATCSFYLLKLRFRCCLRQVIAYGDTPYEDLVQLFTPIDRAGYEVAPGRVLFFKGTALRAGVSLRDMRPLAGPLLAFGEECPCAPCTASA